MAQHGYSVMRENNHDEDEHHVTLRGALSYISDNLQRSVEAAASWAENCADAICRFASRTGRGLWSWWSSYDTNKKTNAIVALSTTVYAIVASWQLWTMREDLAFQRFHHNVENFDVDASTAPQIFMADVAPGAETEHGDLVPFSARVLNLGAGPAVGVTGTLSWGMIAPPPKPLRLDQFPAMEIYEGTPLVGPPLVIPILKVGDDVPYEFWIALSPEERGTLLSGDKAIRIFGALTYRRNRRGGGGVTFETAPVCIIYEPLFSARSYPCPGIF